MAQPLTLTRTRSYLTALTLLVAMAPVWAGNDPTRPPPAFLPDAPAGVPATHIATEAPALILQSVLLSSGRRRAIISGHPIALGGTIGDYRLLELSETQAVLQGPPGRRTLELTPGIRKSIPGSRTPNRNSTPSHLSGDLQK